MKNIMTGSYVYNDETFNFNFGTDLSAQDKSIFVRTVVGNIVKDIDYDSVLRNIIFDYTTILLLTDIDTSFLKTVDEDGEMITNMELLEEFLLDTNIIDIVKANASPTLFDELNKAVDKSIEYRTGIHPSPIADSVASLINTLESKVNEIDLDGAMEMVKKFTSMTGGFTPESIVNAYMGSDVHQKNLKEIAESKKDKKEKAKKETKSKKSED